MKRTFAKQGLMSLLAGFFLFGLMLLTASKASAQGINHNWLQADQATTKLADEVRAIGTNLPNLSGQQYNDALAHIYYYKTMYNWIIEGTEVGVAVNSALSVFGTPNAIVEENPFPDVNVDQTLKNQMRSNATSLLTQ